MKKEIILIFIFLLALFPMGNRILAQGMPTQEEAACIQIDRGEIDRAIELLQRILEASPDNLNAQLYQGIAFFLKEDVEAAFQRFNHIEKEINRMVGAGQSFGDDALFATLAMDRRSGVIFSEGRKGLLNFCLGLTLKEKKDLKNAEKKFKNALKDKYNETATHLHLFDLYVQMKNLKSAASQLDELEKISGENDLLIFLDGYLKYRDDKTEDALEAFNRTASTIVEAKKNIARLYYNRGDYQRSLEVWQEILSENLDEKDALINIGRATFHLGDPEKAQEYFSTVGIETPPEKLSPKKVPLVYKTQMKQIKFDLKCK